MIIDGTADLEEVSFLMRSPHCLEMLETLEDESQTRGDLTEKTAVSQVNLNGRDGDIDEYINDDVERLQSLAVEWEMERMGKIVV